MPKRPLLSAFALVIAIAAASPAIAAGGGGGGGNVGGGGGGGGRVVRGSTNDEPTGSRGYEKIALKKYDRGMRYVAAALELEKRAAEASDPSRSGELLGRAKKEYDRALRQFDSALSRSSDLHEVHSDRGFVLRKLGDYETALLAYDAALAIKADYAPAIEYRGEAYLELGRIEEAKRAYLSLAADEADLADMLLGKMQAWLSRPRAQSGDVDPSALEAFDRWVAERARIAHALPEPDGDPEGVTAALRW